MLKSLQKTDPQVAALIGQEMVRQTDLIRMIASENYASAAVQECVGSVLSNKYSEGYAGRRYYQGQENIDAIERLAIERLKTLFGADSANVQPYSGSPANLAVYFGLVNVGDTVMGLGLPHGGHLSHGWHVNFSGKLYNAIQYPVDRKTELIDYAEMRRLAKEHKPKLIFAGTTAYPRVIDWTIFREVADEIGAYFVADIAHIAGLIAADVHPSPVPLADAVSSTTHKTFRGPRGGMILSKKHVAKKINRAVFPGLQGGPHNNTTAGIAVAAHEATLPDFKAYAERTVANAKALGEGLAKRGYRLVTGGTDNHLLIVDLTDKNIGGKPAAQAMEKAGIVCNYNSIPFDPRKPFNPSGIRIGTAALASRKVMPESMDRIAGWIDQSILHAKQNEILQNIKADVRSFLQDYHAPGVLI